MDLVRKLISERMKDLGLNMAQISRLLGRNETYMQNFLKTKGSPRELHERERRMLAEILKVPEDELRGPSTVLPTRGFKKNTTVSKSLVEKGAPRLYVGTQQARTITGAEAIGHLADLPIYSMVSALNGAGEEFMLSSHAIDWEIRPPMLAHVRDAYGVIVARDVMEPMVRKGSTVLFNPHLPPRQGDLCLFRADQEDGSVHIRGLEYRGETAESWKVRQYNPPKDFTLKKSEYQSCHRAVANYFT